MKSLRDPARKQSREGKKNTAATRKGKKGYRKKRGTTSEGGQSVRRGQGRGGNHGKKSYAKTMGFGGGGVFGGSTTSEILGNGARVVGFKKQSSPPKQPNGGESGHIHRCLQLRRNITERQGRGPKTAAANSSERGGTQKKKKISSRKGCLTVRARSQRPERKSKEGGAHSREPRAWRKRWRGKGQTEINEKDEKRAKGEPGPPGRGVKQNHSSDGASRKGGVEERKRSNPKSSWKGEQCGAASAKASRRVKPGGEGGKRQKKKSTRGKYNRCVPHISSGSWWGSTKGTRRKTSCTCGKNVFKKSRSPRPGWKQGRGLP